MEKTQITFGSLFTGVGGFDLGLERAGMQCLWQVEIDKHCNEVLEEHFPKVERFTDVKKVGKHNLKSVDLICGGFPCFPKDTLILTNKGYIPIQDIKIGDFVYTHKGRFSKVTNVMNRLTNEIVTLSGRGLSKIETTPDHPFYFTEPIYSYKNKKKITSFKNKDWISAKDMEGKYWVSFSHFIEEKIPDIELLNVNERIPCEINSDFFWFVGLWLGDGWLRKEKRYKANRKSEVEQIFVCANYSQKEYVVNRLKSMGFHVAISDERTTSKIIISSKPLYRWLENNFSKGASNKTLPFWVYGMKKEYRQSLLEGYLYADGYSMPKGYKVTTVSKKLAHGIKLLSQSLGYSSSVFKYEVPATTVIEGRTVSQLPQYQVAIYNNPITSWFEDSFVYGKVRKINYEKREERVYNISVEEDESYVADGIIVHNCQDLSVAGKRAGFDGKRSSLWFEFERIISEIRPKWVFIENVPGLLTSKKGRDFGFILSALDELGYCVAWRVFDSQFFGVPQRRRRVFIVGSLGNTSSAEVLFESESMSGNIEKGKRARENPASRVGESYSGNGRKGRIETVGALQARDYKGVGNQYVTEGKVVISPQSNTINVLNDQGGAQLNVTKNITATLRSQEHGHQPIIATNSPNAVAVVNSHGDNLLLKDKFGSITTQVGSETTAFFTGVLQKPPTTDQNCEIPSEKSPVTWEMNHASEVYRESGEIVHTLTSRMGTGGNNVPLVGVRRLTPIECERLQGFPDGWTVSQSDTQRYKQMGNAVTVNVIEWIGKRIISTEKENKIGK